MKRFISQTTELTAQFFHPGNKSTSDADNPASEVFFYIALIVCGLSIPGHRVKIGKIDTIERTLFPFHGSLHGGIFQGQVR